MSSGQQRSDARPVTRLCLIVALALALVIALAVPMLPTYSGFAYSSAGLPSAAPQPAGSIPFGSPAHLAIGVVLLIVAPVAGRLAALLLLRHPGNGASR